MNIFQCMNEKRFSINSIPVFPFKCVSAEKICSYEQIDRNGGNFIITVLLNYLNSIQKSYNDLCARKSYNDLL